MSSSLSKNMLRVCSIKWPSAPSQFVFFPLQDTLSPYINSTCFCCWATSFPKLTTPRLCCALLERLKQQAPEKGERGKLYCCVQMGITCAWTFVGVYCHNFVAIRQCLKSLGESGPDVHICGLITICLKLPHNPQTLKGTLLEETQVDHSQPLQSASPQFRNTRDAR